MSKKFIYVTFCFAGWMGCQKVEPTTQKPENTKNSSSLEEINSSSQYIENKTLKTDFSQDRISSSQDETSSSQNASSSQNENSSQNESSFSQSTEDLQTQVKFQLNRNIQTSHEEYILSHEEEWKKIIQESWDKALTIMPAEFQQSEIKLREIQLVEVNRGIISSDGTFTWTNGSEKKGIFKPSKTIQDNFLGWKSEFQVYASISYLNNEYNIPMIQEKEDNLGTISYEYISLQYQNIGNLSSSLIPLFLNLPLETSQILGKGVDSKGTLISTAKQKFEFEEVFQHEVRNNDEKYSRLSIKFAHKIMKNMCQKIGIQNCEPVIEYEPYEPISFKLAKKTIIMPIVSCEDLQKRENMIPLYALYAKAPKNTLSSWKKDISFFEKDAKVYLFEIDSSFNWNINRSNNNSRWATSIDTVSGTYCKLNKEESKTKNCHRFQFGANWWKGTCNEIKDGKNKMLGFSYDDRIQFTRKEVSF